MPNNTKQNWKDSTASKNRDAYFQHWQFNNINFGLCEWKLMFWQSGKGKRGYECVCVYVCASLECRTSVSILNEQLSVPPLIPVSSGKMMVTHNLNKPGYCNTTIQPNTNRRRIQTECSKRLSLKVLKHSLTHYCHVVVLTYVYNDTVFITVCPWLSLSPSLFSSSTQYQLTIFETKW